MTPPPMPPPSPLAKPVEKFVNDEGDSNDNALQKKCVYILPSNATTL